MPIACPPGAFAAVAISAAVSASFFEACVAILAGAAVAVGVVAPVREALTGAPLVARAVAVAGNVVAFPISVWPRVSGIIPVLAAVLVAAGCDQSPKAAGPAPKASPPAEIITENDLASVGRTPTRNGA
jgi:hypothetical protein